MAIVTNSITISNMDEGCSTVLAGECSSDGALISIEQDGSIIWLDREGAVFAGGLPDRMGDGGSEVSVVKITGFRGWSDCEDCGSYDWETFTVKVDGSVVLSHDGDGHLGGGVWHEWEDAVVEILTAMGHAVEIDISYDGDAA